MLMSLHFPVIPALACAPVVSMAVVNVFGVVFGLFGVPVTGLTLTAVSVITCLTIFILANITSRSRTSHQTFELIQRYHFSWITFLMYLVIGTALCGYIYILALDGPNSFVQEFDNATHLNLIRAFTDSFRYSTLQACGGIPADELIPFSDLSFYPSGWHVIAAICSDVLGTTAMAAENIVNSVFIAFIFPSAVYMMLSLLFNGDRALLLIGSIVCLSFSAFPWGFLVAGPLYSNFASFALFPIVFSIGLLCLDSLKTGHCAPVLVSFLFGCFSLSVCQPNSLFTLGIFLFVPILTSIPELPFARNHTRGIQITFIAMAVVLWCSIRDLPLFSDVVSNDWDPYTDGAFQAFVDYFDFGFRNSVAQPELACFVLVGLAFSYFTKRYQHLIFPYLFFFVPYVFAASFAPEDPFGSLFSGYWYNDVDRIAACASLAAIPFATLGIRAVMRAVSVLARFCWHGRDRKSFVVIFCCLVFMLLYSPSYIFAGRGEVVTAFGNRSDRLAELATSAVSLTRDEIDFLDACAPIVKDDLVLNNPFDGSAFAYSVSGLNVANRTFWSYESMEPDRDLWTISRWLFKYAQKESVQRSVEKLDAAYVVILDKDFSDESSYYSFTYNWNAWRGFQLIDDDTPGFSLVLQEGDMCLYSIDRH